MTLERVNFPLHVKRPSHEIRVPFYKSRLGFNGYDIPTKGDIILCFSNVGSRSDSKSRGEPVLFSHITFSLPRLGQMLTDDVIDYRFHRMRHSDDDELCWSDELYSCNAASLDRTAMADRGWDEKENIEFITSLMRTDELAVMMKLGIKFID